MCSAKRWEASDNKASMKSDFKKGNVALNMLTRKNGILKYNYLQWKKICIHYFEKN